jgi:hypothetical protein
MKEFLEKLVGIAPLLETLSDLDQNIDVGMGSLHGCRNCQHGIRSKIEARIHAVDCGRSQAPRFPLRHQAKL